MRLLNPLSPSKAGIFWDRILWLHFVRRGRSGRTLGLLLSLLDISQGDRVRVVLQHGGEGVGIDADLGPPGSKTERTVVRHGIGRDEVMDFHAIHVGLLKGIIGEWIPAQWMGRSRAT